MRTLTEPAVFTQPRPYAVGRERRLCGIRAAIGLM